MRAPGRAYAIKRYGRTKNDASATETAQSIRPITFRRKHSDRREQGRRSKRREEIGKHAGGAALRRESERRALNLCRKVERKRLRPKDRSSRHRRRRLQYQAAQIRQSAHAEIQVGTQNDAQPDGGRDARADGEMEIRRRFHWLRWTGRSWKAGERPRKSRPGLDRVRFSQGLAQAG